MFPAPVCKDVSAWECAHLHAAGSVDLLILTLARQTAHRVNCPAQSQVGQADSRQTASASQGFAGPITARFLLGAGVTSKKKSKRAMFIPPSPKGTAERTAPPETEEFPGTSGFPSLPLRKTQTSPGPYEKFSLQDLQSVLLEFERIREKLRATFPNIAESWGHNAAEQEASIAIEDATQQIQLINLELMRRGEVRSGQPASNTTKDSISSPVDTNQPETVQEGQRAIADPGGNAHELDAQTLLGQWAAKMLPEAKRFVALLRSGSKAEDLRGQFPQLFAEVLDPLYQQKRLRFFEEARCQRIKIPELEELMAEVKGLLIYV